MPELGQSSSQSGNTEIFRRLTDGDFNNEITAMFQSREPIITAVHGLFDEIESSILPVPEGATIHSEKTAALGALALASGYYNTCIADSGIEAEWSDKFGVAIPGIDPMISLETVVTFNTKTKVHGMSSEYGPGQTDDELWEAIMIAKHNRLPKVVDRSPWVSRRATLLGVEGTQKGRRRRRFTYESDETDGALRQRIGRRLLAMPQLDVISSTYLQSWYGLQTNGPVLQLATSSIHHFFESGISPPELLPARLRALRGLLRYG